MLDQFFKDKITNHSKHIQTVGMHCSTEETTKQALILPLLEILGFSPFDPTKVKAEYSADFAGSKNGERVDYALFCQNVPVMFIEAKAYSENLSNHCPQLSRYFNATPEVKFAAITNGKEWRFFTDLKEKNIMDENPFLKVNFESIDELKIDRLHQFCHDNFQPEALRALAEESIYLSSFTKTITHSLKDITPEFVRYVASHSNVSRQLNQKFIESITPIVKQAIEKAVSAMVVSGLATKLEETETAEIEEESNNQFIPIIDPNNSKIITTYEEQTLFGLLVDILGEDIDLQYKDTESYFTILYQGKTNRWLVRYFDNKQRPTIQLPLEFTDELVKEVERAGLEISGSHIVIDYPENILRISGLIKDCLDYCQDDENFRVKKK